MDLGNLKLFKMALTQMDWAAQRQKVLSGVRKTFEASPDGNKVIIEEQMQKVGSTRGDYNTAVTLMQAHMRMLKMATGSGGG